MRATGVKTSTPLYSDIGQRTMQRTASKEFDEKFLWVPKQQASKLIGVGGNTTNKIKESTGIRKLSVREDGERSKKTHPIKLVSLPTGDWKVIQPGNEPSSKGEYELLLEGTLGSGRFTVIVETNPMDSKLARPGTIVTNYNFIDEEESDIEGGR